MAFENTDKCSGDSKKHTLTERSFFAAVESCNRNAKSGMNRNCLAVELPEGAQGRIEL